MIKHVDQIMVSGVFNEKLYKIPKYQREYTWGINEWDALFNDIIENDKGYFLGSFICVNTSSLKGNVLEVIDGQQRFSTITLLLVAIYEKLTQHKLEMDDDELNEYINLRNELANKTTNYSDNYTKTTEYTQRLFLQKQNCNDEDYSYILYNAGIITNKVKKPAQHGNRRIAKAYKHFEKLIDDEILNIKKENKYISDVGALMQIKEKINCAVFVGIEVDTNKDAYMLFESLNHRGVPLSALDLIKNTLISQSETDGNTDNAYETWKEILNFVSQDEYSIQERFFRQYYNAFRDELNKPYIGSSDKKYPLGYFATRTTLLDIYEKMIKYDYKGFLSDLFEKAQKYSIIVNNCDDDYIFSDNLKDLERIAGAPSYILLIYLLSKNQTLRLSDDNINEIIEKLIVFFVRRNLTDIPNTRKLTQFFIDIISVIKTKSGEEIVNYVCNKLKEASAPDVLFEEKLRGNIYDDNPDVARFVLYKIESLRQTKENYTDLWIRDNSKKYIWTIEHIFPEGENIPESWIKMIADGDKDKAKEYRRDYVHKLGNLTLTGYNQNLSNMSFEQKMDRQSKDGKRNIGYKNGLFLNEDIINKTTWTINEIEERTNKMVRILLDVLKW